MNGKTTSRSRGVVDWLVVASLCLLLVIGLAACGGDDSEVANAADYTFTGLPYDPLKPAADFALVDQNNQPFRLIDHRGKLVVLAFGFTHCPDVCPTNLNTWKRVKALLGDRADEVQFAFITVDPERDTPEHLGNFVSIFDPTFAGLSGSLADIEDVAQDYSVFFEKVETDSPENYLVNHTALTFVVDQDGQLALAFPYGTSAADIAADLEYLLQ